MITQILTQIDWVSTAAGFTAGVVIGAEGLAGIGPMGLSRLGAAPWFDLVETRAVGPDVLHRWVRKRG